MMDSRDVQRCIVVLGGVWSLVFNREVSVEESRSAIARPTVSSPSAVEIKVPPPIACQCLSWLLTPPVNVNKPNIKVKKPILGQTRQTMETTSNNHFSQSVLFSSFLDKYQVLYTLCSIQLQARIPLTIQAHPVSPVRSCLFSLSPPLMNQHRPLYESGWPCGFLY